MSISTQCKLAYLSYFSRPASDRIAFRDIYRNKPRRIVECGIGTTDRSQRLIAAARLASPNEEIYFTGIDLFEARSSADGPGVSLKLAHRRLSTSGARVKLIPGDPLSAFTMAANMLMGTDLVIISQNRNRSAMNEAWFFMPRILHPGSTVLEEHVEGVGHRLLKAVPLDEVTRRATLARGKQAA